MSSALSFQDIIFQLQHFWAQQGCAILQPYDIEVGAGTSHPATLLRALGKKPWNCAFVQPCRRPKDGRYGDNPNRTQLYYQFQVIMKPTPSNPQELTLKSLECLGVSAKDHDLRFVEDDWENPSLGAAGLGWEIWCDGMEIIQFTYFQQVGGIACDPVPVEITYGLERIATLVQNVDSHFDIRWNAHDAPYPITYADVFHQNEREFSAYNFKFSDVSALLAQFKASEDQVTVLLENQLVLPAYEHCVKANHIFNLLDARGVISVTERAHYIARVRAMAKKCCELYCASLT